MDIALLLRWKQNRVGNPMFFKSRKRRKSSRSRRVNAQGADAGSIMSRGVVTVSICAGASMWGYAMINLAT